MRFSFTKFLHIVPDVYCAFTNLCVRGWLGGGGILYKCSAPGFCFFIAYHGDLSLPAELPHSFERLPIAAGKSSAGNSNAQPGLGATDRLNVKGV